MLQEKLLRVFKRSSGRGPKRSAIVLQRYPVQQDEQRAEDNEGQRAKRVIPVGSAFSTPFDRGNMQGSRDQR